MIITYITWSVSPEILNIGPISVRWYGLLFALAFIAGYKIFEWFYQRENKPKADIEQLAIYMIFGTVIGARLGHILFYNPEYYFSHPLEILMVWKGGLASHGAAIGILIALYLYVKKKKESFLWLMDRIVIVVALGGSFIRLGNLFNSEIIGKPATVPWAFIFTRIDNVPRHPTQLYESLAYLIIFFILIIIYKNKYKQLSNGFLFGLFLILVFTFRFFVEFLKEVQEPFELGMTLDMGQILSIPFVLVGVYFIVRALKMKRINKKD
ncbi:prolipoprotein diacylglyceryl transferase [bacterium BMS3Abin03]|nr:prolipoprotein diacylglyceryl transferase [bacterium BMS3Abin03]HDZ58594.1 prolipoprotein diacylglyceryl transferase [Ignavibacteriales bacterium]